MPLIWEHIPVVEGTRRILGLVWNLRFPASFRSRQGFRVYSGVGFMKVKGLQGFKLDTGSGCIGFRAYRANGLEGLRLTGFRVYRTWGFGFP